MFASTLNQNSSHPSRDNLREHAAEMNLCKAIQKKNDRQELFGIVVELAQTHSIDTAICNSMTISKERNTRLHENALVTP